MKDMKSKVKKPLSSDLTKSSQRKRKIKELTARFIKEKFNIETQTKKLNCIYIRY